MPENISVEPRSPGSSTTTSSSRSLRHVAFLDELEALLAAADDSTSVL